MTFRKRCRLPSMPAAPPIGAAPPASLVDQMPHHSRAISVPGWEAGWI